MAESLEQLRVEFKGDASGLEATIYGIVRNLNKLEDTAEQTGKKIDKSAKKTEEAYESASKKLKKTGETINDATKPLQTASMALTAGGIASAKFAIDFQNNFANVEKTVDGTKGQLSSIKKSIIDMTTVGINGHSAIPLATEQLTELAAAGGQLGIATENITKYTETMAMLGTATNLQGEQGAATLARFMNVANVSQDNIDRLGSSIVDLGNNFATTEAEIADMALNMGATGSVIGMSAQDILAYSTALSSLGVEAAAGGSAVSRIWMDIQTAVSGGGEALEQFAVLSGKSAEEFSEKWKKDASGAFKDFLQGLNKSEDVVGVLSELGFNNIRDIQALQRLAGEKGFELLENAITRSNNAWNNNNALIDEFEKKAETTASQMQITKNNIIEAARSIGETMLPTIAEWSGSAADFAKHLSSMSEESKRNIVNAGTTVIAFGAAGKVLGSTVKSVGAAIDTGKTLIGVVGALPAPAKLAAAGIIGLGVAAKITHDQLEKSRYHWNDGISDGNEKIQESLDKYKQLSQAQNEIKDLKLVIENPESSREQVENAKKRIEEIQALLEKEYKLEINVSDDDVEKIDNAFEKAKYVSRTELKTDIANAINEVKDKSAKATKTKQNIEETEQEINALKEYRDMYKEIAADVELIEATYPSNNGHYVEGTPGFEALKQLAEQTDLTVDQLLRLPPEVARNERTIDSLEEKYNKLKSAMNDFTEASKSAANKLVEFMQISAAEGDEKSIIFSLEQMGELIRDAELDMNGYAQAAAQAMSGIGIEEAVAGGGEALDAFVSDYIRAMTAFQASAQDTAVGAALIKNGFKSIGEAAEAGMIDTIIAQANELGVALGLIPADKKIVITAEGELKLIDEAKEKIEDLPEEHNTEITAEDKTSAGVESAKSNLSTVKDIRVRISAVYTGAENSPMSKFHVPVFPNEKGTQNFGGGLAMVNDEKGTADPRELIIDKGRAFIPQGRDVILPLSKGARVYTAKQTKALMTGLGIPHYASGKDNSEAFISARDNWTHYTATHAIDVSAELEKWVEFSKQFTEAQQDVWDIQERIFELTCKQTEEMDKASEAWIIERTALNDWENDDPLNAFERVKQRSIREVEAGWMLWDDYTDNITDLGEKMYDERVSQSQKWLEHEREYNNMSDTDYIDGLQRIAEYTKEYYSMGIISHRKFREAMTEIDEDYLDSVKEANQNIYAAWQKDAEFYLKQRELYEDWEYFSDSPVKFYERSLERLEELYSNGNINFVTYHDEKIEAQMDLFRAYGDVIDDVLGDYQEQIDKVKDKYDALIESETKAYDSAKLSSDIADVQKTLTIYSGAVTEQGKEKYKQAQEHMAELQHQAEIKELEEEQAERMAEIQSQYDIVEKEKTKIARQLTFGVADLNTLTKGASDTLTNAIQSNSYYYGRIINAIESAAIRIGGAASYTDNRNISIATGVDANKVWGIINGTTVSGLGTVMYGGKRYTGG